MKTTLFILLLTSSAFAQDQTAEARVAPSCGPNNVSFDVKIEKNPHQSKTADAGKTLVYVIEDDTRFQTFPKPTVRVGVDGEWVGATHGNSTLSFSVEPGEHHLCASWQSYFLAKTGDKTAAAISRRWPEAYITFE